MTQGGGVGVDSQGECEGVQDTIATAHCNTFYLRYNAVVKVFIACLFCDVGSAAE